MTENCPDETRILQVNKKDDNNYNGLVLWAWQPKACALLHSIFLTTLICFVLHKIFLYNFVPMCVQFHSLVLFLSVTDALLHFSSCVHGRCIEKYRLNLVEPNRFIVSPCNLQVLWIPATFISEWWRVHFGCLSATKQPSGLLEFPFLKGEHSLVSYQECYGTLISHVMYMTGKY